MSSPRAIYPRILLALVMLLGCSRSPARQTSGESASSSASSPAPSTILGSGDAAAPRRLVIRVTTCIPVGYGVRCPFELADDASQKGRLAALGPYLKPHPGELGERFRPIADAKEHPPIQFWIDVVPASNRDYAEPGELELDEEERRRVFRVVGYQPE